MGGSVSKESENSSYVSKASRSLEQAEDTVACPDAFEGPQPNSPLQTTSAAPGGIVVVNKPKLRHDTLARITLPRKVYPILSLDNNRMTDPRRHPLEFKLSHYPWIDLVGTLEAHFKSRADLVHMRQGQLFEKINHVEHYVQKFTTAYVSDKHKALIKIEDGAKRSDEIQQLLVKCDLLTESCISAIEKLNSTLPKELALKLEYKCVGQN